MKPGNARRTEVTDPRLMPDPRPEPPLPPDDDACCGSGCNPCVYDLYDAALERYRAALHAWPERHPEPQCEAAEGLPPQRR
jgi:hypothetical protein